MDRRPIGVFDSGLGGLTAVRKFMELLPSEDIVYLGDTGRVPYGSRSKETIIKYARQDIEYLLNYDIKALAVACGTVSALLDEIVRDYNLPVFGVVEPSAKKAVALTKNNKVGVIATNASINSGAYNKAIRKFSPAVSLFSKACPLLVPLVENGRVSKGDIVIETVISEYLQDIKDAGVDTLLLGCTHYPLLSCIIRDFMGDNVAIVDSGAEAVEYMLKVLEKLDSFNDNNNEGVYRYYVTDADDSFSRIAALFLQRDVHTQVTKIELL